MRKALLALCLLGSSSCAAPVVAVGDSVTFGWGGAPGGWVTELSMLSGIPIANLGIPGESAMQASSRVGGALGLVLDPFARTVIILEGGNDARGAFANGPCNKDCDPSIDEDRFQEIGEDLREIRDQAAHDWILPDRKVVFATYWPPSRDACLNLQPREFTTWAAFLTRLDQEIVTVAAEHGDPVVRLDDLTDLPDDPDNYFDCLHPSPLGYHRIALRWMQDLPKWAPW